MYFISDALDCLCRSSHEVINIGRVLSEYAIKSVCVQKSKPRRIRRSLNIPLRAVVVVAILVGGGDGVHPLRVILYTLDLVNIYSIAKD